jgi:hypothetical protein
MRQKTIKWSLFKSWLKALPKGRSFKYVDPYGCAVAAFVKEAGCKSIKCPIVDPFQVFERTETIGGSSEQSWEIPAGIREALRTLTPVFFAAELQSAMKGKKL